MEKIIAEILAKVSQKRDFKTPPKKAELKKEQGGYRWELTFPDGVVEKLPDDAIRQLKDIHAVISFSDREFKKKRPTWWKVI